MRRRAVVCATAGMFFMFLFSMTVVVKGQRSRTPVAKKPFQAIQIPSTGQVATGGKAKIPTIQAIVNILQNMEGDQIEMPKIVASDYYAATNSLLLTPMNSCGSLDGIPGELCIRFQSMRFDPETRPLSEAVANDEVLLTAPWPRVTLYLKKSKSPKETESHEFEKHMSPWNHGDYCVTGQFTSKSYSYSTPNHSYTKKIKGTVVAHESQTVSVTVPESSGQDVIVPLCFEVRKNTPDVRIHFNFSSLGDQHYFRGISIQKVE